MYSLNIPVSEIRTKMRQEFERHRYVNQIGTVDVLLTQSNAEFQVSLVPGSTDMNLYIGHWERGSSCAPAPKGATYLSTFSSKGYATALRCM